MANASEVRLKSMEKKMRRLEERSELPQWKQDLFEKIKKEGLMVGPSKGDEVAKVLTDSTD